MHFTESGTEEFLKVFDEHRDEIRYFPGCTHLELLKDVDDPLTLTTLSHWQDGSSLLKYRSSPLFKSVWGKVKIHFSRRTEAFSLEKFITP
jgi:quinol monooxygenase YgiN